MANIILEIIASKDIDWNWYKIDKKLSRDGLGGQCNPITIVNLLSKDGLVEIISSNNTSMPIYKITEKGLEFLDKNLLDHD